MKGWEIALIVIVVLLILGLTAFLIYWFVFHNKNHKTNIMYSIPITATNTGGRTTGNIDVIVKR